MQKVISPESWKQTGLYFNFRSMPIFFKEQGKGEAVLFLHGFPTSSWDWAKIWPSLKENYRLIAPDFLGFGFSSKPTEYHYSIYDQASLVEALMRSLGIDTCHIVAHDYGVSVVQEMLARSLEDENYFLKMKSITFLNGGLFPETHKPRLIQKLFMSKIGGLVSRLVGRSRFGKSFSSVFGENNQPTEKELDDFWSIISYKHGNRLAAKLVNYIPERDRNRDRWVSALTNASVMMKLINGPLDPVSGIHMAKRYHELVPNANINFLEGVGHYPHWESAEETAHLIDEFLREVSEY
ncbi:alpha/beta fold hydrolase [Peijinzhouia sedimentorum]